MNSELKSVTGAGVHVPALHLGAHAGAGRTKGKLALAAAGAGAPPQLTAASLSCRRVRSVCPSRHGSGALRTTVGAMMTTAAAASLRRRSARCSFSRSLCLALPLCSISRHASCQCTLSKRGVAQGCRATLGSRTALVDHHSQHVAALLEECAGLVGAGTEGYSAGWACRLRALLRSPLIHRFLREGETYMLGGHHDTALQ